MPKKFTDLKEALYEKSPASKGRVAKKVAALSNGAIRRGRKEVWKNRFDEWHWRLLSGNGQVIAQSAVPYSRRGHAIKMMEQVLSGDYADAPIAED